MKKLIFAILMFPSLVLASGLGAGGSALHGLPKNPTFNNIEVNKITQTGSGATSSFTGPINVTGIGSQFSTTTFTSGVTMQSTLSVGSNLTMQSNADLKGGFNKYLNSSSSYIQATSGQTFLSVIPNGAGTTSGFFAVDRSDYNNNSNITLGVDSSGGGSAFLDSSSKGSHSTQQIDFKFDGTTKVSIATDGSLSSAKPCATNYTRVSPNYCKCTASTCGGAFLTFGTCTTVAAPASDAVAVDYVMQINLKSQNATGDRYAGVAAYASSSCSTIEGTNRTPHLYEQVATTASTNLLTVNPSFTAMAHSGNTFLQYYSHETGSNSSIYYGFTGYRD